ncbi:MAG: fatty acid desaturase [Opitutales bacterium]
MAKYDTLPQPKGHQAPSLETITEKIRRNKSIKWYRCKLPKELHKELHQRSDWLGAAQTLGYLGLIVATGALTLVSAAFWPLYATLGLLFLHGTCTAFMINAVHELGHGTVFKTRKLNQIFVHVFAFIGWINHEVFGESHARHHRYTLHPPDDLEVVLPVKLMVKDFFLTGLIDSKSWWGSMMFHVRLARRRFKGEWEATLYPEGESAEKRARAIRWSRLILAGHGTIFVVSMALGWWMVPVVVSLNTFHSKWLLWLTNNTQHIGLQDHVSDFRMCCRTFTVNPVVQFLYWHMNYHIEHHMYAAVPCYKLGRLHRAIRADLPHCPDGIVETWREIFSILRKQENDPTYQHVVECPAK